MKPRKTTYLLHRWIGLIISLQLLAWSVGGFIFSVLDIDEVHGDNQVRMHEPSSIQINHLPLAVRESLRSMGVDQIADALLIDRGLGAFWEIRDADGSWIGRMDSSGTLAGLLTSEQAKRIAENDFLPQVPIQSAELIEDQAPSEYRGGQLPAYQVAMDHPKHTRIYIDASNGRIMARRNKSWRIFDFFWMLHTMDYKGRDNFNHPLLTIASLFAIAASSTGLILWGWRTIPRFFKRRKRKETKSRSGLAPNGHMG